MAQAKGRKGKIGKSKGSILAYYGEHRREKSHIRRILKHLKRYTGNDECALEALSRFKAAAGIRT